jgi:putative DNA primase/helicase
MNQIQQAPATGTQTAQSSGPANGQLRQMPLPGFSNESQPPSPGEQRAEERTVGSQIPEGKPASVAEAGSRRRFSEITRQWLHFGRGTATSPGSSSGAPPQEQQRGSIPTSSPESGYTSTSTPDLKPEAPAPFDIPIALRNRYLIDGTGKYYFRDRDNGLAFEDLGTKLRTTHEDSDTASSMVELAKAKGWTKLKLRGTDAFKRESWLAAAERGIAVSGYRPTPLDKARLAEREAARERAAMQRANAIEQVPEQPDSAQPPITKAAKPARTKKKSPALDTGQSPVKRQRNNGKKTPVPQAAETTNPRHRRALDELKKFLRQRGDSETAVALTASLASEELAKHRTHFGRLVEHGAAPYQHVADNDASYFVTLQTPAGRQTIWGVDLKRAIEDSGAAMGDGIVLSQQTSKGVTVKTPERDGQGNRTGRRVEIDATRHEWEVISLDNAREFLNPQRGDGKSSCAVHSKHTKQIQQQLSESSQPAPAIQKQR